MSDPLIEVRGLWRHFDTQVAVRDVSFCLDRGDVVGLLGRNGAGKTTVMRVMAGLLAPTAGSVLLDGARLDADPLRARRAISYLPEQNEPYPEMRVHEYLAFRAALRGLGRDAIEEAVERVGLGEFTNRLACNLSKGMRRRTEFAASLIGTPPVLLLDEPTAGLDPKQVLETRKLVAALSRSCAILLSTHQLHEVEASCNRVVLLDRGRIATAGRLEELLARKRSSYTFACRKVTVDALREKLDGLPHMQTLDLDRHEDGLVRGEFRGSRGEELAAELARAVVTLGGDLLELHATKENLEAYFEGDLDGGARP